MFWRLLLRSVRLRRSHSLTAMLAIVVAAAVSTALLNLYADLDAKLTREFRRFGGNALVSAREGSLPVDVIARLKQIAPETTSIASGYAAARVGEEATPIVVVGTDLTTSAQSNTWWSVNGRWPRASGEALIGKRVAQSLPPNTPTKVVYGDRTLTLIPVGTLSTGGTEDSRIYISLADLASWTGLQPNTIELSIPGAPEHVNDVIHQVAVSLPKADVQAVRQVVEAETKVLGKTRFILFLSTILISILVALCVLATLSASVLERRRDFAVMKALGSSQRSLNTVFVSESLLLGTVGALVGYALGCGLSAWIGYVNFHALVIPRLRVFPMVVASSLVIAVFGASLPLLRLQKIEPAVMLRGE